VASNFQATPTQVPHRSQRTAHLLPTSHCQVRARRSTLRPSCSPSSFRACTTSHEPLRTPRSSRLRAPCYQDSVYAALPVGAPRTHAHTVFLSFPCQVKRNTIRLGIRPVAHVPEHLSSIMTSPSHGCMPSQGERKSVGGVSRLRQWCDTPVTKQVSIWPW
jgi:hypothetical protein